MYKAENNSVTLSKATTVYREYVHYRDVARGYLNVEIANVLGENMNSDNGTLDASLEALNDQQTDRLLEAISYTYRMNGVFHAVTDQAYDWSEVELPLDAIRLTETKPEINKIVFSSEVQNSPVAFAEYLNEYFSEHVDPSDDPDGLNEFRIRSGDIPTSRLITVERNKNIEVIDGNHRLMTAAMLGAVSVRAFAGIPNGQESKSMKGDSVFLTLRLEYESTRSQEAREHLLASCILLAESSIDGADAIENYWIRHSRTDDVKNAGEDMLAQLLK